MADKRTFRSPPNIAVEPTPNSLRSYVAAAVGRGSPRALSSRVIYEEGSALGRVMNNCYVLTGAPGSGKTAILREFVGLGFTGIAEPAREVLAEQRSGNGNGVPEKNPRLFCSLMLSIAVARFRRMSGGGAPVFFDRGIPDITAYARLFGLDASAADSDARAHRY